MVDHSLQSNDKEFLTARPWAERGSRFTLDLFLFFFFVSRGQDLHAAEPKIAVNHVT